MNVSKNVNEPVQGSPSAGSEEAEIEDHPVSENKLDLETFIDKGSVVDSLTIHKYCELTFEKRQKQLLELSCQTYLETVPVFKCSNGYELVCCKNNTE